MCLEGFWLGYVLWFVFSFKELSICIEKLCLVIGDLCVFIGSLMFGEGLWLVFEDMIVWGGVVFG